MGWPGSTARAPIFGTGASRSNTTIGWRSWKPRRRRPNAAGGDSRSDATGVAWRPEGEKPSANEVPITPAFSRLFPLSSVTMKSRKIALEPCIHADFRGKPAVGRARLELATNALKGRCSTIELPTRFAERSGATKAQCRVTQAGNEVSRRLLHNDTGGKSR